MANEQGANMAEVFRYFAQGTDYKMSQFRTDWADLTDKDKADLRKGIGNGTLNY